MLTQERLKELLHYDPITGVFTWRVNRGRARMGRPAGSVEGGGYRQIEIEGRAHKAHRLAWLYTHGDWPEDMLDHLDTDRLNNAISNLRPANNSTNCQNKRRARADNLTGLLGVTRHVSGRWQARITVGRKCTHLGTFGSPEAAHEAYVNAKRVLHPGGTL